MSIVDTGGFPYETIFVKNVHYMITTNIDVSDGLANGAVGKFVHIDLNEGREVTVVWLEFPMAKYLEKKSLDTLQQIPSADLLFQKESNHPPFTSIQVKPSVPDIVNSHIPVVCSSAITIHKSQGNTYTDVVYEYNKTHTQLLMYVALSRVTEIQESYLISSTDDLKFYHGRRATDTTKRSRDEFARLSNNHLETIDKRIVNFMQQNKDISIYSFNWQSLRPHSKYILDMVLKNALVLMFFETWDQGTNDIEIPNFRCVIKYKRPAVRAARVAIY